MQISGFKAMLKNRLNRKNVYSQPEFWDSKAQEMEGSAISMWPNRNLNYHYQIEQFAVIEEFLPDVAGRAVLDVGCGFGRLSRYLAERGAQVTGFDFSATAIEKARSFSDSENPAYRVQSVFELDDNELYDVAFTWGILTVACRDRAELRKALQNIRRALKPGGVLLLLEPIHSGFLARVLDLDLEPFMIEMARAGFRVEQYRKLHYWPLRLALAYIPWPEKLTAYGYRFGQWLMTHSGALGMGDYTAICAKRRG